jgi:hypothetical protein
MLYGGTRRQFYVVVARMPPWHVDFEEVVWKDYYGPALLPRRRPRWQGD